MHHRSYNRTSLVCLVNKSKQLEYDEEQTGCQRAGESKKRYLHRRRSRSKDIVSCAFCVPVQVHHCFPLLVRCKLSFIKLTDMYLVLYDLLHYLLCRASRHVSEMLTFRLDLSPILGVIGRSRGVRKDAEMFFVMKSED